MGYNYSEQTGEKYPDRDRSLMSLRAYGTYEGWCPYYNLEGKYVGARYGFDYAGNSDYYKPSTREIVKNYEDLDWYYVTNSY